MLPQLSKVFAAKQACLRTRKPTFRRTTFVRSTASLSAQPHQTPGSALSKYKVALYVAAGLAAVGGAAVVWYKTKQGEKILPYSAAVSKACMQTLNHGGPANVIYNAAHVLAEMSRSEDSSIANTLVEDGALETCSLALQRHFNSPEEGHRIQGRTIFQILRFLSHLAAFPDISDRILLSEHDNLLLLLVKSGFEIENGADDTWVQPLSHIFVSLVEADLRALSTPPIGTSSSLSKILQLPQACQMLSTQLIPNCGPQNTALAETIVFAISSFFLATEDSQIDPHNTLYPEYFRSTGIAPLQEEFLGDLTNLMLATARAIFPISHSSKGKTSLASTLMANIAVVTRILADQELDLLTSLGSRFSELSALHYDHADESYASDPLLFKLDYRPWHASAHFDTNDALTTDFVSKRAKLLATFQSVLDVLPTAFAELSLVKDTVSTLLAMTSTRDEVLMYRIGQKTGFMNDLLSKWILLDPSAIYSTMADSKTSKTNTSTPMLVQDGDEWETCPVNAVSFGFDTSDPFELSKAASIASQTRHDALQLLSRLSNVPSIASQISISRCMCSVQLEERFPSESVTPHSNAEQISIDMEDDNADDMNAAISTINRLRPIQEIVYNVSRYAPNRVRPSDIERMIAMNPSELESLALLSTISSTTEISRKILSNPICAHFIFNTLLSASKSIPTAPVSKDSAVRAANDANGAEEKEFNGESSPEAIKLRLALQTVANFAKTDPSETVKKLSSSQSVPLLQKAMMSADPVLQRLSVLILARIASVSSLPPTTVQASKKEGKVLIVSPKWVDGVSVLYPSPKRAHALVNKKAPSEVEIISEDEFDLVFIHGINGHPITTWRVEMPGNSESVPVLSKIRERGKIAADEGYRAYMNYLSDPERAAKEIEAEEAICWPRDWLPSYLPHARILTVSYDIALTRWSSSETMPLKQQAAAILQKLRLFGIGERPIVFVAHSFGGLIVKEMLLISSRKEEYRDVLENTKAIMFFSTPHKGSTIAGLANGPGDLFFRGSSAVTELFPNNWYLHHLNDALPKIAPSVHTLSIGEIETCFLSSLSSLGADRYTCHHIVTDDSSNPNWKGDHHKFVKLQFNHRQVCKPEGLDDIRFQLVLDFLKDNAPQSASTML